MAYDVTTAFGADNLDNTGAADCVTKFNHIVTGLSTPALTPPFTLYFPAGTYKFATTPNTLPSLVTIYGDGKEQTIIDGARVATDHSAVWATNSNVILRDLGITTNDDANAAQEGLSVGGAVNVTLENVKFSNLFATGIRAATESQVFMRGCEFTNIRRIDSSSCISGTLQNSIITDCWFHDTNTVAGINQQHCIYLNGDTPGTTIHNVVIANCLFQAWGGVCFNLTGGLLGGAYGTGITVANNTFIGGSHSLGSIGSELIQGLSIVNNTFNGQGCGMSIYSTQDFTVSGNNYTQTVSNGGFMLRLLEDGHAANAFGVISGNTVGSTVGNAFFAALVEVFCGNNILIEDNSVSGMFLGVGLYGAFAGAQNTTDISVRNNRFVVPSGAAVGANGYFGTTGVFFGVATDGQVQRCQVVDNICSGLNYELYFTQSNYSGQPDKIRFRSASWVAPVTSVYGFAHGAAPTNLAQLTNGSVPLPAGGVGAGLPYTGTGS